MNFTKELLKFTIMKIVVVILVLTVAVYITFIDDDNDKIEYN